MTGGEFKRLLILYVEDISTIFAKQTFCRFVFDPEADITFTATEPQTNHYTNAGGYFEIL